METNDGPERRSGDQRAKEFVIPPEITVDLKVAIKRAAAEGQTLDRLSFRPPTVGEMKKISKVAKDRGDEDAGVETLVLLSNDKLTTPEVERLNFIDFQLVMEALQPFTELVRRSARN